MPLVQVLKDRRLRGSIDGGRPQNLVGIAPYMAAMGPKTINLAAVPELGEDLQAGAEGLTASNAAWAAQGPDWIGMGIIKELLQQVKEITKEIKVKRKQIELQRQQKEARAKVQDNLKTARLIPMTSRINEAAIAATASTERGIPASLIDKELHDTNFIVSPELLAKLGSGSPRTTLRASVSRVPIFSHPIDLEE